MSTIVVCTRATQDRTGQTPTSSSTWKRAPFLVMGLVLLIVAYLIRDLQSSYWVLGIFSLFLLVEGIRRKQKNFPILGLDNFYRARRRLGVKIILTSSRGFADG